MDADKSARFDIDHIGREIFPPWPARDDDLDGSVSRIESHDSVSEIHERPDVALFEPGLRHGLDTRLDENIPGVGDLHSDRGRTIDKALHVFFEPEDRRSSRGFICPNALECA